MTMQSFGLEPVELIQKQPQRRANYGWWNEERATTLRELWDEGLSASQIAVELAHGCTRNMVIGKSHRLQLPARTEPRPRRPRKIVVMSVKKKTPIPPPQPIVEAPLPVSNELGVALLDLDSHHCRYIIGASEGKNGLARYCGQQKVWGSSYCAHHTRLCLNIIPHR